MMFSIESITIILLLLITLTDGENMACGTSGVVCPGYQTCCLIAPQQYSCCPYPSGVCCAGGLSCCPHATMCSGGRCYQENNKSVTATKTKNALYDSNNSSVQNSVEIKSNGLCPDSATDCGDEATCCLLEGGDYGCCPYPDATCCQDKIHCCPSQFKCNLKTETCDNIITGYKRPLVKKVKGKKVNQQLKSIDNICEGSKYQCPFTYSCCKGMNNLMECCSSSQRCNIITGTCVNKGYVRFKDQNRRKVKPTKINLKKAFKLKEGFIKCYGKDYCRRDQLCCPGYDGFNYCCPLSQGECDPTGIGCYEIGYKYDKNKGKAVMTTEIGEFYTDLFETLPALKKVFKTPNICGDGTYCENNQTCCPYDDNSDTLKYRCCPFKNANCCNNSCCANGYQCSPEGKCFKNAKYFH
uniref:GRANULINS domain-containing protein n=1 Tax=Parastrongyloides trichosuri TaxID=131310 RepID=A0A0N5A5J7_PARTI